MKDSTLLAYTDLNKTVLDSTHITHTPRYTRAMFIFACIHDLCLYNWICSTSTLFHANGRLCATDHTYVHFTTPCPGLNWFGPWFSACVRDDRSNKCLDARRKCNCIPFNLCFDNMSFCLMLGTDFHAVLTWKQQDFGVSSTQTFKQLFFRNVVVKSG